MEQNALNAEFIALALMTTKDEEKLCNFFEALTSTANGNNPMQTGPALQPLVSYALYERRPKPLAFAYEALDAIGKRNPEAAQKAFDDTFKHIKDEDPDVVVAALETSARLLHSEFFGLGKTHLEIVFKDILTSGNPDIRDAGHNFIFHFTLSRPSLIEEADVATLTHLSITEPDHEIARKTRDRLLVLDFQDTNNLEKAEKIVKDYMKKTSYTPYRINMYKTLSTLVQAGKLARQDRACAICETDLFALALKSSLGDDNEEVRTEASKATGQMAEESLPHAQKALAEAMKATKDKNDDIAAAGYTLAGEIINRQPSLSTEDPLLDMAVASYASRSATVRRAARGALKKVLSGKKKMDAPLRSTFSSVCQEVGTSFDRHRKMAALKTVKVFVDAGGLSKQELKIPFSFGMNVIYEEAELGFALVESCLKQHASLATPQDVDVFVGMSIYNTTPEICEGALGALGAATSDNRENTKAASKYLLESINDNNQALNKIGALKAIGILAGRVVNTMGDRLITATLGLLSRNGHRDVVVEGQKTMELLEEKYPGTMASLHPARGMEKLTKQLLRPAP